MKTLIIIFIFIPFISLSQFIKSNQTDSFTHQKRIVTKGVDVSNAVSFKATLDDISYNTIDNTIYIVLHCEGNGGTILQNDIALLVTEKDTIVIKSVGLQNSYGRWAPVYYDHAYYIDKADVIKLSKAKLLSVRRYSTVGVFDNFIKEKFQTNLMTLSDALLKEMDK